MQRRYEKLSLQMFSYSKIVAHHTLNLPTHLVRLDSMKLNYRVITGFQMFLWEDLQSRLTDVGGLEVRGRLHSLHPTELATALWKRIQTLHMPPASRQHIQPYCLGLRLWISHDCKAYFLGGPACWTMCCMLWRNRFSQVEQGIQDSVNWLQNFFFDIIHLLLDTTYLTLLCQYFSIFQVNFNSTKITLTLHLDRHPPLFTLGSRGQLKS